MSQNTAMSTPSRNIAQILQNETTAEKIYKELEGEGRMFAYSKDDKITLFVSGRQANEKDQVEITVLDEKKRMIRSYYDGGSDKKGEKLDGIVDLYIEMEPDPLDGIWRPVSKKITQKAITEYHEMLEEVYPQIQFRKQAGIW